MLIKLKFVLNLVLYIVLTVFFTLALVSYNHLDPSFNVVGTTVVHNLMGKAGSYTADILWQTLGWLSVFIPLFFLIATKDIFFKQFSKKRFITFLFFIGLAAWVVGGTDFTLPNAPATGTAGFLGFYLHQFGSVTKWYLKAAIYFLLLLLFIYSFSFPLKKLCNLLIYLIKKTPLKIPVPKLPTLPKISLPTLPVLNKEKKKTTTQTKSVKRSVQKEEKQKPTPNFVLPEPALLTLPKDKANSVSAEQIRKTSAALENVLHQFSVNGRIVNASTGPVVTLYSFEPASGVKNARVISLADDIAREMRVVSVRIAVVPGANVIGIEMPNATRETVYLREFVEHSKFKNTSYALPIVLGKDIAGAPVFADLTKMPHLLIAGTTGSGKSVAINTMILSLLYKFTPNECRLIMVDPKMLELSVYNNIPHLLTPVVTDANKAVLALKWAVREMEERYRLMSHIGVRNIDGYNQKLLLTKQAGKKLTRRIQTGFDELGNPIIEEQDIDLTPLPFIVIIVDEMADLMLVAGKEVEAAIQRLAQMARAAGLHLIMATQRPSVDVITGTIKANFPTRISFRVTSKIDSRTIIGEQGAEQLLGRGDMLYMEAGQKNRIHAPFVSDEEVEKVVQHLLSQGPAQYSDAVLMEGETIASNSGSSFNTPEVSGNDLYDQAVAIILRDKKVSTSYLQRQLRVGYNKAADLIERMEKEGVISKPNIAGKREILVGGEE